MELTKTNNSLVSWDDDAKLIIITCPNCNDLIAIEKLNCCIFRHGVFKNNNEQISPHAAKVECDEYIKNNLIFGCGKPFQILKDNDDPDNIIKMRVIICDYI